MDVYIGSVIINEDPDFEGKVKIRVKGIFDNLTDEELPWALPLSNVNGGSSGGFGELHIPKVGQIMQVTFINDDMYSPYWLSFPKINAEMKAEIEADYIDSRVLVYDEDAKLKVMYLPNTGLDISLDESHVLISTDNSIKIEHKDSESLIELIGGKINITSDSEINVASNTTSVLGTAETNVGSNPIFSAVGSGENLIDLLIKMSTIIDAKYPVTGSATQALVKAMEQLILSQNVKTTLQ